MTKHKHQALVRMKNDWNPSGLLVAVKHGTATPENILAASYQVKLSPNLATTLLGRKIKTQQPVHEYL